MSLRLVQVASGAGTELANSTTETSLARKTFAANELSAGKVFRFGAAVRVTDQNSTDTLTPRVRFGSAAAPASNTACAAGAAVDVADNDVGIVDGILEVQSATRAVIYGTISDVDAEGSKLQASFFEILTLAADTVYYLDITGTWSVAHADNKAQAEAFHVVEAA